LFLEVGSGPNWTGSAILQILVKVRDGEFLSFKAMKTEVEKKIVKVI
jgi:hypothetical protein